MGLLPSKYRSPQTAAKKPAPAPTYRAPAPVRTSSGAYVPYTPPAPPAAPTAPLKPPGLGPEDLAYFASAGNRINDTYGYGIAQNQYAQDVLGQTHGRNLEDLQRQYGIMRDKLPGGYAARGLLNSGIYASGLQQFGQLQQDALARLMLEFQQQQGGYGLERSQLEDVRSKALADIESQKAARLQAIAAAINGVR